MRTSPSTVKIFVYNFLTLGLYYFYWCSRSRADINRSAGQQMIPTTWLLVLPAANFWWMWRYAQALERVTYGRLKYSDTFLFYIIANSYLFLGGGFNYHPSVQIHDTNAINWHVIRIIILVVIALCFVLSIIGNAFFCAVMQRKIDKLPNRRAAKA